MTSPQPDRTAPRVEGIPTEAPQQTYEYDALTSFTRFYLDTYYKVDPSIDEIAINRFLNNELKRLGRSWDNYVEISGEGGVHHMISIAPWVTKLYSTDYRQEARAETHRWATGADDAFSWDHYVAMALKHEGIAASDENVASRIAEMRRKIESIESCNVLSSPIVDPSKVPLTPNTITGMFFVSGEVGETIDGWKAVMKNVCDSIAPGGHLFISALRGMKEYEVHRPDGATDTYKCAELYGDYFRELLPMLGFPNPVVEDLEIEKPDVGLPGVIMVSATKVSA